MCLVILRITRILETLIILGEAQANIAHKWLAALEAEESCMR